MKIAANSPLRSAPARRDDEEDDEEKEFARRVIQASSRRPGSP
jgi:hypothetical protein